MAPASMASSPSRDSSSASRAISDGLIGWPSITPPLITRAGLSLAKLRRPLAASTTSPLTNAIADGPTSSPSSSAAMPASAAASLVRVFLTTLNVACSPSAWRRSASWATVRPRYSASTAPLELWNRSVSSATAATFSALAMGLLSWAGRPLPGARAPAASGVGEGPAKRNAPARGTRAWTPRRPRRGKRLFSSDACAGRPQCAGPSATPCQARGDNRRSLAATSLPAPPRAGARATAVTRHRRGLVRGRRGGVDARALVGLGFFGEAPGLAGVDRDARAHGGGQGDLPQVPALGRRRLQPQDLVDGGGVVLHQGRVGEGRLADDEVEVGVPVHPELDLAALDVGDGLAHVGRDRAGFGVGHEPARAQDPAEPAHLA